MLHDRLIRHSDSNGRSRRQRILCLHGARSNSAVTRAQVRNLGLGDAALVHAPGPIQLDGDPAVEELFDGPFFSWFTAESPTEELIDTLRFLLVFIDEHGPFDGVYAFSQGAALAAALLQPDVCSLLLQQAGMAHPSPFSHRRSRTPSGSTPNGRDRSATGARPHLPPRVLLKQGSPGRHLLRAVSGLVTGAPEARKRAATGRTSPAAPVAPTFAFAIFAGAADASLMRARLGLPPAAPLVPLPSVHVIGQADALRQASESTACAFARGAARLVLYHGGGHEVPRELQAGP